MILRTLRAVCGVPEVNIRLKTSQVQGAEEEWPPGYAPLDIEKLAGVLDK